MSKPIAWIVEQHDEYWTAFVGMLLISLPLLLWAGITRGIDVCLALKTASTGQQTQRTGPLGLEGE